MVHIEQIVCIHSFLKWYFCCLYNLATVNNVAMRIGTEVCFLVILQLFWGILLGVQVLGHMVILCFTF